MDVGGWLRSLGLDQYEANFRDNKIDADVLPQLTADDLKDIGVSAVGDRRRLLAAIAALSGPTPSANALASSPKPAPAKGLQISAERRPITVMFCDLVGSTSLAARLDAEDWRNLVGAYLDEASGGGDGSRRPCPEEARRRADGPVRLSAGAGERRRARGARRARHPARARRPQRPERPIGRARAFRPHRPRDAGPSWSTRPAKCSARRRTSRRGCRRRPNRGRCSSPRACSGRRPGFSSSRTRARMTSRACRRRSTLYRIVRASGGRRGGARVLTPLVGREDELSLLQRRWSRALEGEGQFVQIVGEPGIGKSRLVEEFRAKLAETPHTWVEWAASQLLQNTPLHPLAEWGTAALWRRRRDRRGASRRPREHFEADRPRRGRICAPARAAGRHPAAGGPPRRNSRPRNCGAGNWRR